MRFIPRRVTSVLGFALAVVLTGGCAAKRIVFHSDPMFPPARKTHVSVFLSSPVDSINLSPARDELLRALHEPARALRKAKCVWGRGLPELARTLSKTTTLRSGVLTDSPVLPPTTAWMRYRSDVLGVPSFSLEDSAALAPLARDGFDFVVVPVNLSLRSVVRMPPPQWSRPGEEHLTPVAGLIVETPVAVVDLNNNSIMWTGVVTSWTGVVTSQTIGSTALENAAYYWLIDLLAVLNRGAVLPRKRFGASYSDAVVEAVVDTVCK